MNRVRRFFTAPALAITPCYAPAAAAPPESLARFLPMDTQESVSLAELPG